MKRCHAFKFCLVNTSSLYPILFILFLRFLFLFFFLYQICRLVNAVMLISDWLRIWRMLEMFVCVYDFRRLRDSNISTITAFWRRGSLIYWFVCLNRDTVTLRQTVQHHLFLYKSLQKFKVVELHYKPKPHIQQVKQANYIKNHMHVCSECLVQRF